MFKIRYGINKKREFGPGIEHKQGTMEIGLNQENWENDRLQLAIRDHIRGRHPGWSITGYCILDKEGKDESRKTT